MKCKNCKRLEYRNDGRERYAWCPFIGDNPDLEFERYCGAFKKMTNADRIRNMNDEELAEYIAETMLSSIRCHECQEPEDENGVCIGECKNEFLRWLQKEVE